MRLQKFIGLFILLLPLMNAYSQNKRILATLSKDSILIGDQLVYSVIIPAQIQQEYEFASAENLNTDEKILIRGKLSDTISENNQSYIRHNFIITCFDSGVYLLPPVKLAPLDTSNTDSLLSNTVKLVVGYPEIDPEGDIRDIKDLRNTPLSLAEIIPYIIYVVGGFLLLTLIIALIWMAVNRKKISFKPEVIIPPHLKALNSLDEIKESKLWQKGNTKEYYTLLSNTVRLYIEEQFSVPAMESVSNQIIRGFERYYYDDDQLIELLESLLSLSDLVKFAKEDPTPSENETNLNKAYIFIEKTKPVEKPKENENTDDN